MAADVFLKLKDIKGESLDAKHKDEINVLSFSWGMVQPSSNQYGGGAGVSKAMVQDLHFTHYVDKATPDLWKLALPGKHITEGILVARKAGDKPLEYLKVEMKDIIITNIQFSGHGGSELPQEQVSLSFSWVKITYTPQKADGTGDSPAITSFDIKANKSA